MAGPNDLFRKYPTEAGAGKEHPSGIQLQYPTDVVRLILENAQDAIYISQDRYLTFINAKAAQITGYTLEELMSRPAIDFVHPDDREAISDRYNRRFRGEEVPDHYPHRLVCKNGNVVWIEANHVMITWQRRPAALTFVRDITSLKKAEEELKARMESIEEMNTTLKVLLRQRNDDIQDWGERLLRNVKELVMPHVVRLKEAQLGPDLDVHVRRIECALKEITSPFLANLSAKYPHFTSREIQVANLIKDGMRTKEIAHILNISSHTVDIYRQLIRKKLGLNHQKTSIRSFLLNMK